MHIDKIREQLAVAIQYDPEWLNKLEETEPGHYGIDESEVVIDTEDLYVDIPNLTFTFDKVPFNFDLQLGSSKEDDAIKDSFERIASGNGTFEFDTKDKDKVILTSLEVQFNLDLYAEEL